MRQTPGYFQYLVCCTLTALGNGERSLRAEVKQEEKSVLAHDAEIGARGKLVGVMELLWHIRLPDASLT